MGKKNLKKEAFFKKIAPYMGNKKLLMAVSMLLSAVSSFIQILPFYFIWKISNELFAKRSDISMADVKYYAAMVFVTTVVGMVVYFVGILFSHFVAFEVEKGIKKVGFKKIMHMPLGFFHMYSSGKIRKIINDGASETHGLLAHQLFEMVSAIVTPVLILIVFFYFDWRLGLAAIMPILLSFFMMSRMMNDEGKAFYQKYMDALEEMNGEAVEYVRSIPVVKTFGQSVKSFTRFYNSILNYRDMIIAQNKLLIRPASWHLVFTESTALFLIPAAILIINNDGHIGTVISNFVLYILVAPQLSLVMVKTGYFKYKYMIADQSMDRFHHLLHYEAMVYPEKKEPLQGQDIEFKDVVFSYDGEKKVLDRISFKVNKGETLAFVGPSGSGKTTVARLAARFWDVNAGEILIGGKNIKDYDKETLMHSISFVFQNTELFKTSLRDNICFGRAVRDEVLQNALRRSRSKEIVDNLEMGLETIIGSKGTYLSGGEKQRIALARAFIKDAPIVLLDEATAFTDPENEHLIQAALQALSEGKTTIMIAHRMTTVKNADHIAVLAQGKIVEYGDHDSLMEQAGLYKQMWDEYQRTIDWNIRRA
ncbi:MAG: ABC transporter ATP-binding protein [Eubacteriales bacterium]|nr:ABC transporter ATP-binding protein [Eubacteriales bacterium]